MTRKNTERKLPVSGRPKDDLLNRESWKIFQIMAEFVDGFERLSEIKPSVSIFGSARTPPDHPWFRKAEAIARRLSDAGFSVVSGGGPGGRQVPEHRPQHRTAPRTGSESPPGHLPDLPPFLHPQGHVRQVRHGLRGVARRFRHPSPGASRLSWSNPRSGTACWTGSASRSRPRAPSAPATLT